MNLSHFVYAAVGALLFSATACNTPNSSNPSATKSTESKVSKDEVVYPTDRKFTYSAWPIKSNDSVRKAFRKQFDAKQLKTIFALNRVDENSYYNQDTLIMPDRFDDNLLAYSPFPYSVSSLADVEKIAFFSYPIQAYGLYENGKLVKWGPTSMGTAKNPTPTGLFFTNWKGEEVQSTFDDEWILKWNFNIENEEGIGWHQYALPGYPASHSCLRLLSSDAKWMYDWATEWTLKGTDNVVAKGTPVIVFGEYDFNGSKPWYALLSNPNANDISEQQMNDLVQPHLSQIMSEQANTQKNKGKSSKDAAEIPEIQQTKDTKETQK